jgi:hypothetical protein
LAGIVYVPALQTLFRFSRLSAWDLSICAAAGVGSLLWFEAWKLLKRRFQARNATA